MSDMKKLNTIHAIVKAPEFIFIGPDKSGSTWIYDVLSWHPQIYVAPSKELEYFDRYYHRGLDWYLSYFKGAEGDHRVHGEVCHNYLFSTEACERIHKDFPRLKLLVCLREPVARAFSSYLYMIKQGRVVRSFTETIDDVAELIDHGCYARHLLPYIENFGMKHIYVGLFDNLQSDPVAFANKIFCFLGVDELEIPEALRGKSLPASRPRSLVAAQFVKQSALLFRALGLPNLVTKVKTVPLVQHALYKEYDAESRPRLDAQTVARLQSVFRDDIKQLDNWFGLGLLARWGYE